MPAWGEFRMQRARTRLSDTFGVRINGSCSRRDFTDKEESHDDWRRLTPFDNTNECTSLSNGADLTGLTRLYRPISNV